MSMMGGTGGMNGIGGKVNQAIAYNNQTAGINSQASAIGAQSQMSAAYGALSLAGMEANGAEAQMMIKQIISAATITSDLESLGVKAAGLFAGKALETYTFIAQTREKTLGLFKSIIEARTQTAWDNMKKMSQQFKF